MFLWFVVYQVRETLLSLQLSRFRKYFVATKEHNYQSLAVLFR